MKNLQGKTMKSYEQTVMLLYVYLKSEVMVSKASVVVNEKILSNWKTLENKKNILLMMI